MKKQLGLSDATAEVLAHEGIKTVGLLGTAFTKMGKIVKALNILVLVNNLTL